MPDSSYKPSYMSPEEMQALGIDVSGKVMETGERRARLKAFGLTSNITDLTAEGCKPGWQDAHYHIGVDESYMGAVGEFAVVIKLGSEFKLQIYDHRSGVLVPAGVHHNVFVFAGAKFFCNQNELETSVGNPDRKGNDWYAVDDPFWKWSKEVLGEQQVRRFDGDWLRTPVGYK